MNAIIDTQDGGRIAGTGEDAFLTVEDTGVGILQPDRVDNARSRSCGGTRCTVRIPLAGEPELMETT